MTEPTHEVPQDILDMIEVSPEEASTNFYWNFGKHEVFKIQTTIRGNPTTEEVNEHIASAIAGMKLVIDAGGHATGYAEKQSPAPGIDSATAAALETGKAVTPPPVSTPTLTQNTAGERIAHCAMIEVGTSYQGGKTQLKFHCEGMDYPLTYTKAVSDMVKLLSVVGNFAGQLEVGKKIALPCLVIWNETQNGEKKYKNVIRVLPAP